MLRRVALVRTDVSEERIASTIMVTRIGELRTLAVATESCGKEILCITMYYELCISSQRVSVACYC
jgi:hypothetical protein